MSGIGWLVLTGWLLRRWGADREVALGVSVLTGACGLIIYLSANPLSETLFGLLTSAALGFLVEFECKPAVRWVGWGASAAVAAYHTRTIGMAILAAGLGMLALRRQWRHAAIYAAVAAAGVAPWIVWQMTQKTRDAYLSSTSYYMGYNLIFNFAWAEKIRIAGWNFILLPVSTRTITGMEGMEWVGFLALPFMGLGWWKFWRKAGNFLSIELFVGFMLAIILLWAWMPARFLVPIVPWCLWLAWEGFPRQWAQSRGTLAFLCAGFLTIGAWASTRATNEDQLWLPQYWRETNSQRPLRLEWKAFTEQVKWLRENTREEDVAASNLDPSIFLLTGRKSVRASGENVSLGFYLGQKDALGSLAKFRERQITNRTRYLVLTAWPWFSETAYLEKLAEQWQKTWPQEIEAVGPQNYAGFSIYRLTIPEQSPTALSQF